ncbi:cobalamin-binding protein [Haloechinothrix sp. YIM 98757]|uniref:Cobalamin-binding protein n=1 Tax=Haloechinothrix aidingensis TaxID=2752311 RepID=A0A837ZW44_9PSEU|nr:cobalamin-binding protein [Haloechinothrix aidingensis]MBA0124324.1 cobalamin-binding protein [Haloechinothrix aidingensis]
MRIVSLLPSTTEILFALGLGDHVVGVTFECDHPPEARTRRVVSTSTLQEGLSPAEIDAAVTRRKEAGEDLYHLDTDALAGLDAELVITQDLCAVCAASVSTVQEALTFLGSSAEVLTIDPHTLSEVLKSINTIGDATGTSTEAGRLVTALSRRLDDVRGSVAGRGTARALVLEWTDPPYAPGHWVPDMVHAAGGECVLGRSGERSFRTDWDSVTSADPEVVISAPCGFALDESVEHAGDVVRAGVLPDGLPVWAVDANAAFARPGPRLVDGVEALAGILHPEAYGEPDPSLARRVR